MKVITLNIKEDYPPADVAVANLEIEIERCAKTDIKAIKVIHGYGSHGVGGEIKRQLIDKLKDLKRFGKIKDFIVGEQFGYLAKQNKYIADNFPDLIVDPDLRNYNNGITLVFLNN